MAPACGTVAREKIPDTGYKGGEVWTELVQQSAQDTANRPARDSFSS